MSFTLRSLIIAAASMVALSACSAPAPKPVESASAEASATATAAEQTESEAASSEVAKNEPVKVMSCKQELTFEKAPERIILLGDDSVPFILGLDQVDKVVAMGEKVADGVYDDATKKMLDDLPFLEGTKTSGGGTQVSTEKILEHNPDLVIGYDSGVDREALTKAGVPLYSPDAWCPDAKLPRASFDLVNSEIRKYAKMFFAEEKGEAMIKDLEGKIAAVKTASGGDRGTGMGVYIDEGAKEFWGYGNTSMVNPQFEAVGLKNVYDDRDERLIEGMSMEEVLSKNPQTIVLLYQNGTPDGVKKTFTSIPGASDLDAVKNNKLFAMPFVYTDPPTPTSVEGVEKLSEILGK